MREITSYKQYDLEERTFQFAKKVALFCKNLPRTLSNMGLEGKEILREALELKKIFSSIVQVTK
jgi:hypothetical protein